MCWGQEVVADHKVVAGEAGRKIKLGESEGPQMSSG